ncbi:MAG: chromosome segregation protein SMC [Xanthomonadales bacterium]|nr:chromosome segregation protein SMC [Xanthomonadales bacterium]
MRLASIKLAGFKSFVDPTTLELPTNLTAVVGPNGCGKSNIIDAIRWVMGESAASRLRGDAITDVIFNGASERKPVGQASVELVFDNADGQVGGEYAAFAEISVKRVVSRDAVSTYFLNGSRCRRRDITDLFLGTGLGARSYSIIEQGMISQIVEAAPEDLRAHLEEAAGISKYKERRKETESRIRATRENLSRLDDVRGEVDKQLEHLRRQARQAERYTELKADWARLDGEHRSLCLRDIDAEIQTQSGTEAKARNQSESVTAELHRLDAAIEKGLVEHQEAGEAFNEVQGQHYAVGAELSKLEQQQQFGRQTVERLRQEEAGLAARQQSLQQQDAQDRQDLAKVEGLLAEREPVAAQGQAESERIQQALSSAESSLQQAQQQYEQHHRALAETQRRAEVARTRIEYQERQQRQHLQRMEQIQAEQAGLDPDQHAERVREREAQEQVAQQDVDTLGQAVEREAQAVQQAAAALSEEQSALAACRQQAQTLRGRLASLETLQHAALGQDRKELMAWLGAQGLADAPRLGTLLQVDDGWAPAVESVLGSLLEAVVVDAPHTRDWPLQQLPAGVLSLVSAPAGKDSAAPGTLAAHVRGPAAVAQWLHGIHVADDLAQARALLPTLPPTASVITPDGCWLGPDWMRIDRGSAGHEGVLARAKEIEALGLQRHTLEDREKALQTQIDERRQLQAAAEKARTEQQQALYQAHRRLAEQAAALKSARSAAAAAQQRAQALNQEVQNLQARIAEEDQAIRQGRAEVATALSELEQAQQAAPGVEQQRQQLRQQVDGLRQEQRSQRDQAHALALELQQQRSRRESLQAALRRAEQELAQVGQRSELIATERQKTEAPLPQLESDLARQLERRVSVEAALAQARERLEQAQQSMRSLEQSRQAHDQALQKAREAVTAEQLKTQALQLRREDMATALAASGHDPVAVLATLADDARAGDWAQRVSEVETRVRRLEPVNLAAISELAQQEERKGYLDSQHADLSEALETLEGAIAKIDRETRTRFKDTFDRVSAGVKEIFPRLFGGGHAYLELTGEDLLSTGVTIMARPPGKRVSNIGLLSGGEKALTAVSLVFAIFRLNPAPFCLLDEVDAPLDEANVGRFSEMVVEMSKSVQFIVVTHNKVTMESMTQLAGVTMREPGVSRLVSVDLAEASRLVQ